MLKYIQQHLLYEKQVRYRTSSPLTGKNEM